ncbi:flagellar biosynthesis repressor FlbT [Enterovirga sp.]|uniref:flagellar biosynthesis repressor FlbT n=1 Tax=Enterovirga sp. TaxID=2026350 RepID=UPI002609C4E4|nr:flagellar biosynthesis repressor FlbT [Enterovirga sp.]MDB5591944.1 flagellar FlbT family protein [Enterovirga sp.]
MSLKVELKPGERIIIGTAVVRSGDQRVRFFIEGDAPILREKDILTPATATTPARKIYLALQLMYLTGPAEASETYIPLVREFLGAVPSAMPYIARINNEVLSGDLYKALKTAKSLIAYEQELINHAFGGRERLCEDSPDDAVAA